ncbi:hypothetical protein RJ639_040680 [Escallonia herrerae]|uniref:Uncharacterized protein n=1 Tax=Escallonia herrerae TaxID=1293975 RepID=A0AA89B5E6_9ASTE|nr:hypothetical protein RJ639_040680 [Escallonia herrerae]
MKSKRRRTHKREVACIDVSVARQSCFSRFGEVRKGRGSSSWRCGCKGWESDGEAALEAEIMKFMKESEKPEVFPTKKELVEAGRTDLVDGIVREGGWMSLGWDLDSEDDDVEVPNGSDNGAIDLRDFQRRVNSFKGAKAGQESSPSASPSGRSL